MPSKITLNSVLHITVLSILLTITASVTSTQFVQSTDAQSLSLLNTVTSITTSSSTTPIISQVCKQNQVLNSQQICIKPQYIQGCQIYESITTCNKCSSGYLLTKLKKCDFNPLFSGRITHIVGCIKQQSADLCNVCASGFYKKNNKCQLGIKNCATYNTLGECTQCQIDYSLILSQCRHNSILGCKYETDMHTCTQCYQPFKLNNQRCDIQECRILNDYGCVACECGYYLTAQRSCQPITPGCLRYQRGLCKDCLPHYKLKGGVCQIEGCLIYEGNYCKTCSDKYENVEGQCHFKNCLDWLNDFCLSCKKGYGLSNGICISTNPISCQ